MKSKAVSLMAVKFIKQLTQLIEFSKPLNSDKKTLQAKIEPEIKSK